MKVQSVVLAMALVFAGIVGACNSGGSGTQAQTGGSSAAKSGGSTGNPGGPSSGGVGGSGGVGNSGGAASSGGAGKGGSPGSGGQAGGGTGGSSTCPGVTANVTVCGGDVTGTWTVTPSCLNVSGPLDPQVLFGLSCTTGQVTGTLNVTGTWSAKSDGTFVDGTTMTGNEQFTLPPACLILSGTTVTCDGIAGFMGAYYDTVDCTAAADGGCACSATVNQKGSIGASSADPQTKGNYTTASNAITITQDNTTYAYCVSGNKLSMSPPSTAWPVTGTIVLQQGSTGSGGAPGNGGATGKGGGSGSGGVGAGGGGSGAGGAAGAGGKTGAGGTSASGGKPGADGGPASGGSTGTGGSTGMGGSTGTGGSTTRGTGPCDIYAAASMPCAAAYSMVRALSSKYSGPLYQVRSGSSSNNTGSGGTTRDIGMTADGYADSGAQDTFCTGSYCTVSKLYDQSGNGNDLVRGSAGPSGNGPRTGNDDYESTATKLSITAGGHKVYALYMAAYEGYRTALNAAGKGMPTGNKDEGKYELADGTHYGTACCWDFGDVSPDPNKYVTMNTIFFGTAGWGSGAGSGPWFMGDFEGGVWAGGTGASTVKNQSNPSMKVPFALGILHTPVGKYALRMADIQTAADLTTAYDGAIVSGKTWGNAGGIGLGIGGDNSNNSYGTFYEGAITSGAPSNATDLLIMKNIQAVGYSK